MGLKVSRVIGELNHFRAGNRYPVFITALTKLAPSNLVSYGIPMLILVSYVGSLGIPFSITLVIKATGASARAGMLDPWLALHKLRNRFGQHTAWQQANNLIHRQGGLAIFLTRFWLTPLAPVVNVMAGGRYPYPLFLLFDLAGDLLWVILYGWDTYSRHSGGRLTRR